MAVSEDQLADLLHRTPPAGLGGVDFDCLARTVVRRRRRNTALTAAAASLVLGAVAVAGVGSLPGRDPVDGGLATVPTPAPGETTPPSPAPAPSAEPQAPVPPADARLVLTADGSAAYYSFGPSSATLVTELAPPTAGSRAQNASRNCVLWSTPEVICYRGSGDVRGEGISGVGAGVQAIAVSDAGDRLAWIDGGTTPTATVTVKVADLSPSSVSSVVSIAPQPGGAPDGGLPVSPSSLAWAGTDALALSLTADGDDGSGLVLQGLDASSVAAGWLTATRVPVPESGAGNVLVYDLVATAGPGSALVVERESSCCLDESTGAAPASRVVRVSLPDGTVTGASLGVADAQAGRYLLSVSGSGEDVVYVTASVDDPTDTRVYLRRGNDERGTLVSGLPGSVVTVAF